MISHGVRQKYAAIISDDLVVFNALRDNATCSIQLLDSNYAQSIAEINKIDLLIIDKKLKSSEVPFYRVNTVVNLAAVGIVKSEIYFQKPFKLEELLAVITSNMQDKYLFHCINNSWMYHQRLAKISSSDTEILLTDKENALFAELLTSENFSRSKEFLKKKIWNYHQDSESTTVETHLYKLKQKLPDNLLEMKTTQCCLRIDSLV